MSLRSKTREDSHFLVKFVIDSSLLVRSRSLIKTRERIVIGSTYPVQWGNTSDIDDAIILSSGDYIQLRRELEQYDDCPSPEGNNAPSSPDSPDSPSDDERSPPKKRARVIRRSRESSIQAKVSKPLASVITRAPAPVDEDDVFTFRDEDDSSSVAVARALFSTTSTPFESDSSTFPSALSPLPEPSTPTVSESPAHDHLPTATPVSQLTPTAPSTSVVLPTPSSTPTSRPSTPAFVGSSTSASPLVVDRTNSTLLSLVKSVLAKNNVMTKILSESNLLLKRLDAKVSSQAVQIQILQEQFQHLTTLNHPTSVPPSALINPEPIVEESENNPYTKFNSSRDKTGILP